MGRIPALEAARGVAALMVVAVHVNTFHTLDGVPQAPWLHFTAYGWLGVHVFFVLSGLVLYLPYARGKPLRLGDYASARVLRIVPALWVALTVSALATGIWSTAALRHALFVNPWGQPGLSADPPAWSLTVEMGFYLLLPALIVVFAARPRYRVPVLVGLLAAGLICRYGQSLGWPRTPVTFVDNFAAGMLAAVIVTRWKLPQWTLAIGAIALVAALALTPNPLDALPLMIVGLLFAVTLASLAGVNPRTPRALVWLGTISYGIYLWHWPVLEVASGHGLYRLPDPLEPVAVAAIAILLGWASWKLIERPALKLRNRHAATGNGQPTGAWLNPGGAPESVPLAPPIASSGSGLGSRLATPHTGA